MTYKQPSAECYGQKRIRKAFRFTIEVGYRLRKISDHRGHSMAYTLEGLITEWWELETKYSQLDGEELEKTYDWGYRANSMQKYGQKRYMKQFRLAPDVCTKLKVLSKWKKETQASICEGLINGEFERLQEQGYFKS